MYLVFDLGGSFIKIAKANEKGEILEEKKEKTPSEYDRFIEIIEENIDSNIKGIAFSSPGSVNKKTGEIGGLSAIEYIHHNNFCKYIKEKYNINVSIENDANCSALGEVYFSDEKINSALFLTIGTGIGGAIIYDGKLIPGINGEAGEFGYMMLNSKFDDLSNFSRLGTLPNTVTRMKEEINVEISTYEALDMYFEKKEPVYTYVNKSFEFLQMGIYNMRYFFDPEILIIGGAISEDKRYIEELKRRCPFIKIKACSKFNTNNILGALANHLQGNYII